MGETAKGVLAMLLTCTVWGLSPLYYALLDHVPPLDILSYRALWSLVFFAAILALQRRLGQLRAALRGPQKGLIAVAAVVISLNWFGFIFAIQTDRALEASLGYYIFPLMAVLMGRALFGEVLDRSQWIAVALATLAVVVLSAGLGVPPWVALGLAASFVAYSGLKKRLDLGPVVSVGAEVVLLAPLAVLWLALAGSAQAASVQTHALLALSGPLTAVPLVAFSFAARRIRMSTVGVLQYLNPTLQFGCAVLVFGNLFTVWHAIAFGLIWTGLALYSVAGFRQDRALRKAARTAATSGTIVT